MDSMRPTPLRTQAADWLKTVPFTSVQRDKAGATPATAAEGVTRAALFTAGDTAADIAGGVVATQDIPELPATRGWAGCRRHRAFRSLADFRCRGFSRLHHGGECLFSIADGISQAETFRTGPDTGAGIRIAPGIAITMATVDTAAMVLTDMRRDTSTPIPM